MAKGPMSSPSKVVFACWIPQNTLKVLAVPLGLTLTMHEGDSTMYGCSQGKVPRLEVSGASFCFCLRFQDQSKPVACGLLATTAGGGTIHGKPT